MKWLDVALSWIHVFSLNFHWWKNIEEEEKKKNTDLN